MWNLRRSSILTLPVLTAALLAGCREDAASRRAEAVLARTSGLAFLRRDQLPEAEREFRRVADLAPRDPIGYANLGLTYLRAGRLAEAEEQLDRARRLSPASSDVALMLARVYSLTDRTPRARQVLENLPSGGPDEARALYALAELEDDSGGGADIGRYEALLGQVLTLHPTNLAVRVDLADVAIQRAQADTAVAMLEDIRRIPPQLPADARALMEETILHLRAGRLDDARSSFERFRRIVEVTAPYQAALEEVKWVDGPLMGRPVISFEPQSLIALLGSGFVRLRDDTPRFVDITEETGLARGRTLAAGDINGDGSDDLLAGGRLYHVRRGFLSDGTDRVGLSLEGDPAVATFADADNDGWLDLFVITADGDGRIMRNDGSGTLVDFTATAGPFDARGMRHAVFVDLDHDGDLDLLLAGGERRLAYRNNADGTFTEAAEAMGLAGAGDARSVHFADFDGDGRIDLFIATAGDSDILFHNLGGGRFADETAASGLATASGSGAAAVGDFDNDGWPDIFVSRVDGGEPLLWRNGGDGTFERDGRSAAAVGRLRGVDGNAAEFVDIDNDGWLDLVIAGRPAAGGRGVFLLRNDGRGRFEDRSTLLPPGVSSGTAIVVTDIDDDGDLDLIIGGPEGPHLLRNDGGNTRLATRVQLSALTTGSGKNNAFGIGSRIELRTGELHQTRVVTDRVTHFGLGPHLKADVLRIEWPNGVPQTVYFPGTDEDVLELEQLKGSCAFLYTWDGTGFRFITDVTWRSALGMPLGIMGGGDMAYAPAGPSQEYLRIPGEALQPRDGRYVLQLTEELWETAYMDAVRLLAVDHPDSVGVYVDERFVPPAPVELQLFKVVRPRPPRSATDGRGNDLLPALRERDDVYAPDLTPLEYQGLVEPHDIILDLGEDAGNDGTLLLLQGWIYPTDASINVALSQRDDLAVAIPSLEVRDASGQWTTAIESIGFPSGKDKTIVLDLTGLFPTRDHRVRIRTNMQIHWDHVFVATEAPDAPARIAELTPGAADLHFRGYSRMYRKGGRTGPHWFDYDVVSRDHPWRPIEGAFTRYGDVLPLLTEADDRYVIMAPGDEMTVEFDAASADSVPSGWARDYLLYTDGWIKDADMNTAFGNTVEPLPFRDIRAYPYAPGESYPTDSLRERYHREYNTRIVRRR